MPPKDKLNRLEELKSKLFNKNYKTEIKHRDTFSPLRKKEVMDSWQIEEETGPNFGEKFFMKTSRFKKFFISSMVFFLLAVGYAAFVFFIGGNTVSNDNIEISIVGNNFTAGGEELPLVVGITNKNNTALDLVDLIIQYPKGSDTLSASEMTERRQSLGTIPSGAIHNENINLVLFGEQGSVRPIKVSIEYRVAGSNAIFVKEKTYDVRINSTPINLSVEAPSTISPNQDVTLKIKVSLNATKPASKILVKVDYPVGFSFVKGTPAPAFGSNVWDLGDMAPGAEREISVSGKMIDVFDGEEKTFNISSGSQSPTSKSTIGVVFNSIKHTIAVSKPFIAATLFVNGVYQKEYASDAKTDIHGEIRYVNNLDTTVNDVTIEAKLSGNALNQRTVSANQGYYDSAKNTIVWDKHSDRELKEVNPGDSGSVSFSFSPKSLFSEAGLLSNPSINIEVNISGAQATEGFAGSEIRNSSSANIRIISDVGLSAKALHYSGPFTNTGSIPPKVETPTTYTIVWTLSNTANNISSAKVASSLPAWVSFVGTTSPATESLAYNSRNRELVWNVDRIPKGTGITASPRSVSFQVSLTPSLSQVGSYPVLINEAVLTGHDDFANVNVQVEKDDLDTNIMPSNDPAFPLNGGLVDK